MNRTINRLKIIFVGLFLVLSVGVLAYHQFWVWPKARCEARGGAWAPRWMKCATVYSLETLTGRPNKPAPTAPAVAGEAKPAEAAASAKQ